MRLSKVQLIILSSALECTKNNTLRPLAQKRSCTSGIWHLIGSSVHLIPRTEHGFDLPPLRKESGVQTTFKTPRQTLLLRERKFREVYNFRRFPLVLGIFLHNFYWVSCTGSASDWCALQEARYKCIDLQYNTIQFYDFLTGMASFGRGYEPGKRPCVWL